MSEREKNNTVKKNTENSRIRSLKEKSRKKQALRKAALRKKILLAAAAAAAVVMIIWGILALVSSLGGGGTKNVTEDGIVLTKIGKEEIRHLSFSMLSVEESDSRISAEQFQGILEELYQKGYCLIDVYDIAYVDEDGNYAYKDKLDFPEGKIPLILSEREVCYPFDSFEQGVADKMLVEDGKITCQRTMENMKKENGKFDIVPIVESFINKHPDFSYNGARGILGFTGEYGILGYRTSSYLSREENNPYAAAYGLFDTGLERENLQPVLDKLTELGWHFAGNGYAHDFSYGSEYSLVSADVQQWTDEVGSILGKTDIILLPKQTDIGSWKAYSEGNEKYNLLKDAGFSWFFVNAQKTPYLLQIRSPYVRQTVYEINTMADFQAAVGSEEP